MSIKYVSGRVKELKVGVSNYSESKESLSVIGIVSATKYLGDGSTLSGIGQTVDTRTDSLDVVGVSTFGGNINANGNIVGDNSTNISGIASVTATSFHGDGSKLTGIDATALKDAAGNVKAQANPNGVVFTGIITGNGSGLTDLEIPGISTSGSSNFSSLNATHLKVTGVSTYQGDLDIESSVLITGITTIGGLVDINAGGQANTFKVEDLTDNRVVIAGTGGELEDDANLTFNGTQFNVGSGITMYQATGIVSATKFYGDGSNLTGIDATALKDSSGNVKAQANPNGVVFTGIITGNGSGLTNLDIPGISTSGGSTFTNLNVSGVSTFAGNIDANGNLDVDGQTDLDVLNVSDTATFAGNIDIADTIYHTGDSNTKIRFPANDTISLHTAGSERVSIDPNGNVSFTGGVSVTGISTFAGNINANGNIVGDNSTNITGIAGVTASTLTGTLQTAAQPNVTSLGTITNLVASSAKVSDLTSGRVVYAGASGELQDSANLTFNGTTLTATSFAGNGSQLTNLPGIDTGGGSVFTNIFSSGINTFGKGATGKVLMYHADSLKFQTTGIGVSVASGTAKTAYIEGPEEIWIDPHPTGVGTTSGIVRIRGDLYVDGKEVIIDVDKIELGDFQIGIATTAGTNVLLDGAGIGIGAQSIRKTITWNNSTSALMSSENWNLASGKHYEIAGTDVLTATTLGSGVVNSSLTSLGTIASLTASTAKVSDLTNTRVVYAGASGELQDSANLTFDGTTLTGTFAGNGAGLTNVAVTGIDTGASSDFTDLLVNGNLKVTGVSTFTGNIDANGDIDLPDEKSINFGDSRDLGIGHTSHNGYIWNQNNSLTISSQDHVRIKVRNLTSNNPISGGDKAIECLQGGVVELYGSNAKKLETTSSGVIITGTCQATDFNSTSDIKLKTNVQVIEDPLAKLVQIEGVSFNWKENNKPALGVIADQVQEILPELVTEGDPKTVNYNGLIGLLIEAVKEQQIQINELKSKLP